MPKKEKLRDVIRSALRQRGTTQGEAAIEIQSTDSSLRVWLSRNRFPENVLVPLAKFCGLDFDEKALEERYDFEVGSEYTIVPTAGELSGRPDQDGKQEVLRILKDIQTLENPEQLVVHIHSSIGFHSGSDSQLAEEITKFLSNGTSVVFFASKWDWGVKSARLQFDPQWRRKLLEAKFEENHLFWNLPTSAKRRLYWGVDGSEAVPVPFPCLLARVGCVSHLNEKACGGDLTIDHLCRAELIHMWVEISPDFSFYPENTLPRSRWTLISPKATDQCGNIQKSYWQEISKTDCKLEKLVR